MSMIHAIIVHKNTAYKRIQNISLETGLIYTDMKTIFDNNLNTLTSKYFFSKDFQEKHLQKEARLILEAYTSMLQTMNIEEKKANKETNYSIKPQTETTE